MLRDEQITALCAILFDGGIFTSPDNLLGYIFRLPIILPPEKI
ncbi:hypothetical protein BN165_1020032 [Clostridioides difficile E1]|nr:hypothetical protein BN165_1020032 [Clostridioides difficile E1]